MELDLVKETYRLKLAASKQKVVEFEAELGASKDEVICLSPQLVAAKGVCDREWGLG